jgi:uncharacterized SAM-binding protein YcdF (DUF218 family)
LVLFTLLLLFFALFALWRRKRRQIAIVCVLVFWAFGTGWLSLPLLHLAQAPYEKTGPPPRFSADNAIILLGSGTERHQGALIPKPDALARIRASAAVYQACADAQRRCRVIVSGGDPQGHGQAEADNYAPWLVAAGVPESALTLENSSFDTYQNARNVHSILRDDHDSTLIVVTSAYHMRRSLLAFDAFGLHPAPFVSNVRPCRMTVFPTRMGFVAGETAVHEIVGIARFYVWRWLRLY